MAKKKQKVVPDEDIKEVITSEDTKPEKKGVTSKVLGAIIKPLSPEKDKEDMDVLKGSSLRSPLEALLIHEYAKHKIGEVKDNSEDSLVCAIKDVIRGVERQNCGFLRDRESYDKDLGLVSSILKDTLPKTSNLKLLIARALFGDRDYEYGPSSPMASHGKMNVELPKEVIGLLK
jgi:hypothetical protein